MAELKRQNFLHGAAILTVSAIIIKILGAIYKIPLYNIIGKQGTADFNFTYQIYTVVLNLASAGLPVVLSRLVAEADALGRINQVNRIYKVAFVSFVVLGAVGSLVMFLFPAELAMAVGNATSAPGIRMIAPSVLLAGILSAYRGWEQGHSNMFPTSVTQVIEVAVKVIIGLAAAWLLIQRGEPSSKASAGSMIGVSIGTLAACVYIYFATRRSLRAAREAQSDDVPDSGGVVLKSLLRVGVPIALGASAMSIMQLLDSTIISYTLQQILGYSSNQFKDEFGSYSMLLTLHNLPWVFVLPLTMSLVPAISSGLAQRNHAGARNVAEVSLRFATIIALPMGVGMAALAYPVANVLYYGEVLQNGPFQLAFLAIAAYFMCMALMTTSVLQAMGRERLSVISLIVGGVVKVGANFLLISNPDIGINGAAISAVICYLVMFLMNYIFIQKNLREKMKLAKPLLRPIISAVLMGVLAWALYSPAAGFFARGGEMTRMPMLLGMAVAIAAGAIVYLVMIIATRAITLEDMKLIPGGEKLAKHLKIK